MYLWIFEHAKTMTKWFLLALLLAIIVYDVYVAFFNKERNDTITAWVNKTFFTSVWGVLAYLLIQAIGIWHFATYKRG